MQSSTSGCVGNWLMSMTILCDKEKTWILFHFSVDKYNRSLKLCTHFSAEICTAELADTTNIYLCLPIPVLIPAKGAGLI